MIIHSNRNNCETNFVNRVKKMFFFQPTEVQFIVSGNLFSCFKLSYLMTQVPIWRVRLSDLAYLNPGVSVNGAMSTSFTRCVLVHSKQTCIAIILYHSFIYYIDGLVQD